MLEKIQSGLLIASERERARQEVEISELIHKYRAENRNADAQALEVAFELWLHLSHVWHC